MRVWVVSARDGYDNNRVVEVFASEELANKFIKLYEKNTGECGDLDVWDVQE